jgi:hypothetical protein
MSNMSSKSKERSYAGGRVYGCDTGKIHARKDSPNCKNQVELNDKPTEGCTRTHMR